MIAGLPGTGLAGLFFILSALAMPFVQLGRSVRDGTGWSWRFVATHVGMALTMVVAIDLVARLVQVLLGVSTASPAGRTGRGGQGAAVDGLVGFEVFGLPAVVVAVGSLALLLLLSAVVGWSVRPRGPRQLAAPVEEPPARRRAATSADDAVRVPVSSDA